MHYFGSKQELYRRVIDAAPVPELSGTPAEAAAWVQESNVTNHYGFKYWEIGNECYGSWETDTNTVARDPYTYAQRFQQYYTQMKAIDPTIKIGAVAVPGEDSYANNTNHPVVNPVTGVTHNGWTPVMLTTLKGLGVIPDFLIYHRYPESPGAESDQGLLLSSSTWAACRRSSAISFCSWLSLRTSSRCLRSVISRIAASAKTVSDARNGLKLISTGNSDPSARHADSSMPIPIDRTDRE